MSSRSFLFNQTPLWTLNRSGSRHTLPHNVQSWIYETHSLTQRLRTEYGAGVAVKVLFNQWQSPFLSEGQHLRLPCYRYSLIREVLLHIQDKPLILARTVLPQATIAIAKHQLSNLGTRPLGEVIFSYPNLIRHKSDICCIPEKLWSISLKQQVKIDTACWGRRTIYVIKEQPMLVSEFFMPDVLKIVR